MRRAQKSSENEAIQEFLRVQGYEISDFDGEHEQPDAYVTAVKDGETICFDIEHTDYFTDAASAKGGSLEARAYQFRLRVQSSFTQDILQMANPPKVGLLVVLKAGQHGNGDQAGQIAAELIRFAEENADAKEDRWVRSFNASFPILHRFVDRILVQRVNSVGVLHLQSIDNVGVDLKALAAVIKRKNRKCAKYSWREGSQRLLLITTNTGPMTSSVPAPGPGYVEWNDSELEDACQESPFNTVFLWSRAHSWIKQLKP